ncbi:hypothetical protein Pan241w_11230 [Gimesia alba]|uniref:Uncharacterized protein n=1 Tax=Gimesia alba TaxID=2527973 RepID=A0A517RB47_9PLAN|nr:hypothetical protein [Gimesia alba]QDT41064.1 hypothetical protein Pan241w_11230 [Gimesia alba]
MKKVVTEEVNLWKVSTNTHGGLRFKMVDEDGKLIDEERAIELYADQISTDNREFSAEQVMALPGFKVKQIRDTTRCLREDESEEVQEPLAPESSGDSSTE